MRIESIRHTERLGSVKMHKVQKVLEIDSGISREKTSVESKNVQKIEEESIRHFEERMVIVIPVKNEDIRLFEGVISGVPHNCLIIIISNSQGSNFKKEKGVLNQFCQLTKRRALIIHQKDPLLGKVLKEVGYVKILDKEGLIRDGKPRVC
jgi:mannosyl-3-phosphoglycerate synthase